MFVTLTAPSFGAVHTRRLGPDGRPRRCRPRRDAPVCEHGVRLSCGARARRGRPVPRRAALPRLLRPRRPRCSGTTRSASCGGARTIYLPRTLARLTGMTQKRLRELRARRLRQGRRVPAPRARAPARRDPARPRDARLPRARGPPAAAARSTSSCSRTRCARPSPTVDAPLPGELGGGRVRWGDELDVRRLDRRGARRGRRLPRQVRDQEHRTGRRRPAPRHRAPGRRAAGPRARARATCAPRSRSPPIPRSPTGGSAPCAHRSATAATA